ncbi:MAG: hypothetical protein IIB60_00115 [Planctomycetes bacterium]|nr:hypothetical protein [Planctomycetota bacterium]
MVTGVNWETPRLGSGSEVVLPFKGSPLASPLSMADGRLLIPFAGPRKRKVAILQVSPDASIQPFQLDLGKVKPLGPYVCFWEYDARLHFAWSAPKGREIILGRLPLDDPAAGFPTRSVYLSDAPILWIDAYLDTDGPSQEAPYLEEMIPPDQRDKVPPPPSPGVVLWCVTDSPSGLKCTRVNVSQGQGKPATTLPTGGAKDLRVLGSVVTYEFELAMLLADAEDKLYYASTIRGSVEPLADVAGVDITLGEFPALIRASGHARTPWVYLRFVVLLRKSC